MTMTEPLVHPSVTAGAVAQVTTEVDASNPADVLKGDVLRELTRKVSRPDIVLPVPDREGWAVRYSVMLNLEEVKARQAAATFDDGIDLFRLAQLTLAGQCRGLVRQGKPVELDGAPVRFDSQTMLDAYVSTDPGDVARQFYANDPVVMAAYAAILEGSGSGDRLDPTTASSA